MDIQINEAPVEPHQSQEVRIVQYQMPRMMDFLLATGPENDMSNDQQAPSDSSVRQGMHNDETPAMPFSNGKNVPESKRSDLEQGTKVVAVKPEFILALNEEFVGKSFPVHVVETEVKIGDKTFMMPRTQFKDPQAVLSELKKAAKTQNIRVFFPDTFGTADVQPDRINFQFDQYGVLKRCFSG